MRKLPRTPHGRVQQSPQLGRVLATQVDAAAESTELASAAWFRSLRGSRSYQAGLKAVQGLVERAYDSGAGASARHWQEVHEYYLSLARMKGCEEGKPHAEGPIEACHRVSGPDPDIIGLACYVAKRDAVRSARETSYPKLVLQALLVIYDYGYVQGMKHGLAISNDDVRLKQACYRACVARASGGQHEPACADASKAWADDLLDRLKRRIEAHGLPAGAKPQ